MHRRANGTPEIRLSLRAAVGLTVPLLVGVVTGQRLDSIVVSLGALWAISQDGLDAWSVRGKRIVLVGLCGALGVALGAAFVSHDASTWATVGLFGGVALVAGVVETSNWPSPGAYLLIGTIVGDGLKFGGRVWQSALLAAVGAGWVYLIGALIDRRKRLSNQRVFLSQAFLALADLVGTLDTPRFYQERSHAVAVLDTAHDVVGVGPLADADEEEVALRQCLVVALRFGEVLAYLEAKHQRIDASFAEYLREVAATLRETTGRDAREQLTSLRARLAEATRLDPRVLGAVVLPSPEQVRADARRTPRHYTRPHLPVTERWRFAGLLAVATVAATVISHVLDGPHGFWLPMGVAFILRPDVGPVIPRALARTAGTTIGVAIAVLVAWSGNAVAVLIGLSCVMAAVMPWATRRSHLLAVVTFTPIVFVFLSLVGSERSLFVPRIVDTALAAAIVLILDLALWSRAPSLRPDHQLARARRAASLYQSEAPRDNVLRRNVLRRDALRAVADARGALSLAQAEPAAFRRPPRTMSVELDRIEAALDQHTVALLDERSP